MARKLKKGQLVQVQDKWGDFVEEGTIQSIDNKKTSMVIQTVDGQQKVIDLLQFIVIILPLLDQIVDWIGRTWNKVFKKN